MKSDGKIVVHKIGPGTWSIQEKLVPGFRLSRSTMAQNETYKNMSDSDLKSLHKQIEKKHAKVEEEFNKLENLLDEIEVEMDRRNI
jgi:hypothetical protein